MNRARPTIPDAGRKGRVGRGGGRVRPLEGRKGRPTPLSAKRPGGDVKKVRPVRRPETKGKDGTYGLYTRLSGAGPVGGRFGAAAGFVQGVGAGGFVQGVSASSAYNASLYWGRYGAYPYSTAGYWNRWYGATYGFGYGYGHGYNWWNGYWHGYGHGYTHGYHHGYHHGFFGGYHGSHWGFWFGFGYGFGFGYSYPYPYYRWYSYYPYSYYSAVAYYPAYAGVYVTDYATTTEYVDSTDPYVEYVDEAPVSTGVLTAEFSLPAAFREPLADDFPAGLSAAEALARGESWLRNGDYGLAAEAFRQAWLARPDDYYAPLQLSLALLGLGRFELAGEALEAGLDRNSSWVHRRFDVRDAFPSPEAFEVLVKDLQRHVLKYPESLRAEFLLGYLELFSGREYEAHSVFQNLERKGATNPHLNAFLKEASRRLLETGRGDR